MNNKQPRIPVVEKPMTDDELKHAYRARAEREGWPLATDIHK